MNDGAVNKVSLALNLLPDDFDLLSGLVEPFTRKEFKDIFQWLVGPMSEFFEFGDINLLISKSKDGSW